MDERIIIGTIVAVGGGLASWLARHICNSRKHACKDDIVFRDVCDAKGALNEQVHQHLSGRIEAAIKRGDEQHAELKDFCKDEFGEIKQLIRQNGRG